MNTPLTTTEASRLMGLHVKTLQRWGCDGKFLAKRTSTNRRYYTQEQIDEYLRIPVKDEKRKVIVYCRVSSAAQVEVAPA